LTEEVIKTMGHIFIWVDIIWEDSFILIIDYFITAIWYIYNSLCVCMCVRACVCVRGECWAPSVNCVNSRLANHWIYKTYALYCRNSLKHQLNCGEGRTLEHIHRVNIIKYQYKPIFTRSCDLTSVTYIKRRLSEIDNR